MRLDEFRKKYPQYDGIEDRQLADALRSKFYARLSPLEFDKAIGLAEEPSPELLGQIRTGAREADAAAMTHRPAPTEQVQPAAWGDVIGDIPRQVRGSLASQIAGMQLQAHEELLGAGLDTPSVRNAIDQSQRVIREAQADSAATPNANVLQRGVQQGAVSLASSAGALAAGLATRSPVVAAATMYPTTTGQKYGEFRAAGLKPQAAQAHAAFQGAVETGTELAPFDYLLRAASGPVKQAIGFLARELPGETLAQLAQGTDDHVARAQATGKPVTPWLVLEGLWLAAKGLPETWIATTLAGAAQTAPVALADKAAAARPPLDLAMARALAERSTGAAGTRFAPAATPDARQAPIPPEQFFIGNRLVPGTAQFQTGGYDVAKPAPPPATAPEPAREIEPWDEPTPEMPWPEKLKADAELRRSLEGMKQETGWDTVGGRMLRDHKTGEVIGRTPWLPRYPWYKDKPTVHSERQVQAVIDKMLAGRKLGSQEQVLAEWLAGVAADRIQAVPFLPAGDELASSGLEDNLGDAHEAALVARAQEANPDAFERAAIQYVDDDAGFLRAVRAIVDDANAAPRALRQEDQPAPPRPAINRDLFAGSDTESESLARRNAVEAERLRREGKLTGDVPVETGRPDDLFSQARKQTDIEDADESDVVASRAGSVGPTVNAWAPGANYVGMLNASTMPATGQTVTLGARAGDERTLDVPKTPIRREHIMAEFQRRFGVKIYQGKPFRMRSAAGFFMPRNYAVRNRKHNDLEVAAHEVTHFLDWSYPSLRKLYRQPQFKQELKGISYDEKKLLEGFAEFGRLFLTQDAQAIAKAPQFYDAFVQEVRRLGIYDKLRFVQDQMHQWFAQGAEARALSKIGQKPPPVRQRVAQALERWPERAKTFTFDYVFPAKMIERAAGYDTKSRDAVDSAYKHLRLHMHAGSTVNAVLNYGTPGWNSRGELVFTGDGLRQVFEPVADVMDETIAYFVGRRATELGRHGKERLFTPDEAQALIAKGEQSPKAAEIRKAFDDYQKFTGRMLDFAVQSGVISKDTRDLWRRLYQNYVPFQRVRETLADPSGVSGGSPFKRLKGGTENLRDIWQNMVDNAALITQASLRNAAKRDLFREITSFTKGGGRFAVRIPEDTKILKVGMAQVEENLRALIREAKDRAADPSATPADQAHYAQIALALDILTGAQSADGTAELANLQAQATFFLQHQTPGITDKDFFLAAGKPQWFQIGDPLVWDMLQEMGKYKPLSAIEQALSVAKRTLTRGVTAAPEFQLANFARDTYNAFVLSQGGQVPMLDGLKASRDIFTVSDDMKLFFLNGGGFGLNTREAGEAIKLELERLRKVNGKVNIHAIVDGPKKLLELYDKFSQTSELATRIAEFKRMRAKGASLREAAYQANEVSTDFAARGTSAALNFLRMTVPFFGARLQGLGRLGREVNEHPVRLATRALLGITIPTMLLMLANEDDDRYEALSPETKSLYWVILDPSGDGVWLIPKPFEIGALFATMPEHAWQAWKTGQTKQWVDAVKFALLDTFSLNPLPQLIRPPVEVLANYDMFRRGQIVPESLKAVEPREQFNQYTSRSMVSIGQAFGVSPIKLEYLLKGYLGTLGAYGIAAADALVSTSALPGEEPTRKLGQRPIIRRFRRQEPYSRTQWERDFFDMLDESRQVVATANHMRNTLRLEQRAEYIQSGGRLDPFARARALEMVKARVDAINDQMKTLRFAPNVSADEKRQQLDQLQAGKNQLFRQVGQQLGAR